MVYLLCNTKDLLKFCAKIIKVRDYLQFYVSTEAVNVWYANKNVENPCPEIFIFAGRVSPSSLAHNCATDCHWDIMHSGDNPINEVLSFEYAKN